MPLVLAAIGSCEALWGVVWAPSCATLSDQRIDFQKIQAIPERTMPKCFRVIEAYRSSNADPIFLRRGEAVKIGPAYEGDPQWRGWRWCENTAGTGGWVPEMLIKGKGTCRSAREAYDARELSIEVGETLIAGRILNGWVWAHRDNGESGWVPLRHLTPQDHPPG